MYKLQPNNAKIVFSVPSTYATLPIDRDNNPLHLHMNHNSVTILDNGIIFVCKVDNQDEQTLTDLATKVENCSKELRKEGKRVLILTDATKQGTTTLSGWSKGIKIGMDLDYDKSATFGTSEKVTNMRALLEDESALTLKVADFKNKDDAMNWLLSS
jgi:hypothetical protein